MKGIDYIMLITTKSRPERLNDSLHELVDKYGIRCNWFHGVENKEDGAAGLVATMKILFEEVLTGNSKNALMFEDDIHFLCDPDTYIQKCLSQLPAEYHLFYLGLNPLSPLERYSENVLKVRAAYSSHAILYSRSAIELILPHLNEGLPYDLILNRYIQPLGKCYCSQPMIATQRDSPSDIADFDQYSENVSFHKYLDFKTKSVRWGALMEDRYAEMTKHL